MNHSFPIYTVTTECQDCFKCVRSCPVKAIKVEDNHASVIPELCVACGRCVEVCPAHAKQFRDDMGRARQLLQDNPGKVYAALAPSWVSEFKGLPAPRMIAALRKLGFAGVSETALGAQIVSWNVAKSLQGFKSGVRISSACPVVVGYIQKYQPQFAECITQVLSPALTHAKLLHEKFGSDIKVVFIGPCIAKKLEADAHPELIHVAMLFPRLTAWLAEEKIDPWHLEPGAEDVFATAPAEEGALYPIEGGMNDTIIGHGGVGHIHFSTLSGLPALSQALNGLSPRDIKEPVFIEALACVGGCVHGPGTQHGSPGLLERLRVINHAKVAPQLPPREDLEIGEPYPAQPVPENYASLQEIKQAMKLVGKTCPEDELNCGGCGYDTCQNFARALLVGKAEPSMCVSYLRKLSQKKSNAILRCIPASVVIVDSNLELIECNRRFAELCGGDALEVYNIAPGMAGAKLSTLIDFADKFDEVLKNGQELHLDTYRIKERLVSVIIFNIDPGQVVGAILFDVTNSEFQHEQIAERAREVINRNLATVQDIACKLGEHMAETELLLRSIAEGYSVTDPETRNAPAPAGAACSAAKAPEAPPPPPVQREP